MPNALSRSRAIDRAHSTRPLHCACAVKSNSYRAKVGPFCCSSPLAFSLHLLRLSLRDRVIVIRCHCKRSRSICSTHRQTQTEDRRDSHRRVSFITCVTPATQTYYYDQTAKRQRQNGKRQATNFISQPINNATDRHYWPGGGRRRLVGCRAYQPTPRKDPSTSCVDLPNPLNVSLRSQAVHITDHVCGMHCQIIKCFPSRAAPDPFSRGILAAIFYRAA